MNYVVKSSPRGPLIFILILFLSLWGLAGNTLAQTFNPGDAAFTGFNSDETDGFAVVLFVDISAGDELHFNNQEWDGSTFAGSGGDFTWIAPSGGISAGTVLVFSDVGGEPSVNTGTITDDANMSLSGSGDVIYVYTGSDKDTPDTFLGAIATSEDKYNQSDGTEGTLANTGLTQASNETILLSENIDNAEYIGIRNGNTPGGYRSELNDISNNWQEENGNGDQSGQILPFNTQNFTIISPPTIAFSTDAQSGTEGSSFDIIVELKEADNATVNVEVVFDAGASTASASDINGFSSQTVNFSNASTGAQQTVPITPLASDGFEGDEVAVFELQNNSDGSIIDPDTQTLTINDSEQPRIIINEILYDPGADADGNGTVDGTDDEFIEFVNTSSSDIDVSGWTVGDAEDLRHTFSSGTTIPASGALVLFADDGVNPQGGFGGAVVQSSNASSTLRLNNSGDTITLADAAGTTIASVTYSGSQSKESITLSPDLDTSGSYVGHKSADSDDSSPFSPGTKIDGTSFGSTYAIGIRGTEGYRFISSPTENTTFSDLFSGIWMQGISGSDDPSGDPTLFYWSEPDTAFVTVTSMSDILEAGKGYISYIFEDDNYSAPGVQGGFPKVISTNNAENASPVAVQVSATDGDGSGNITSNSNEGYNLLGNPFGTDISVDAAISALQEVNPNVNNNVYIWNQDGGDGNGKYEILGSGDRIAPFQAFFIRYTEQVSAGQASFDRSAMAVNIGGPFYGQPTQNITPVAFELHLGNGDKFDTYEVEFNENGTAGEDRYDGYKLFSLKSNSISVFSTVGDGANIAKNVLPSVESLEGELRVPLTVDVPASGGYIFSWEDLENLSEAVEIYLVDTETGSRTNLRTADEYAFNVTVQNRAQQKGRKFSSPLLTQLESKATNSSRFELLVKTSVSGDENNRQPSEEKVVLSPNYPNPFSSETRMDLQLQESMHVKVTIWNIVAQKVATMVDEMMAGGEHPLTWNVPASMPSGIYICKVEAGGKVITRKMTLVK